MPTVKVSLSDWTPEKDPSGAAFREEVLYPVLRNIPSPKVLRVDMIVAGEELSEEFLQRTFGGLQVAFPETQILPKCSNQGDFELAMVALQEGMDDKTKTHASVSVAPVSKNQIRKFLEAIAARNPSTWDSVPHALKTKNTFLLADGGYHVEVTQEMVRPGEELRTLLCLSDGEAVLLAASSKDFPEIVPLFQAIEARHSKLQKALNHFIQT